MSSSTQPPVCLSTTELGHKSKTFNDNTCISAASSSFSSHRNTGHSRQDTVRLEDRSTNAIVNAVEQYSRDRHCAAEDRSLQNNLDKVDLGSSMSSSSCEEDLSIIISTLKLLAASIQQPPQQPQLSRKSATIEIEESALEVVQTSYNNRNSSPLVLSNKGSNASVSILSRNGSLSKNANPSTNQSTMPAITKHRPFGALVDSHNLEYVNKNSVTDYYHNSTSRTVPTSEESLSVGQSPKRSYDASALTAVPLKSLLSSSGSASTTATPPPSMLKFSKTWGGCKSLNAEADPILKNNHNVELSSPSSLSPMIDTNNSDDFLTCHNSEFFLNSSHKNTPSWNHFISERRQHHHLQKTAASSDTLATPLLTSGIKHGDVVDSLPSAPMIPKTAAANVTTSRRNSSSTDSHYYMLNSSKNDHYDTVCYLNNNHISPRHTATVAHLCNYDTDEIDNDDKSYHRSLIELVQEDQHTASSLSSITLEDHMYTDGIVCNENFEALFDTCSSAFFGLAAAEPLFHTSPPVLMNALLDSCLLSPSSSTCVVQDSHNSELSPQQALLTGKSFEKDQLFLKDEVGINAVVENKNSPIIGKCLQIHVNHDALKENHDSTLFELPSKYHQDISTDCNHRYGSKRFCESSNSQLSQIFLLNDSTSHAPRITDQDVSSHTSFTNQNAVPCTPPPLKDKAQPHHCNTSLSWKPIGTTASIPSFPAVTSHSKPLGLPFQLINVDVPQFSGLATNPPQQQHERINTLNQGKNQEIYNNESYNTFTNNASRLNDSDYSNDDDHSNENCRFKMCHKPAISHCNQHRKQQSFRSLGVSDSNKCHNTAFVPLSTSSPPSKEKPKEWLLKHKHDPFSHNNNPLPSKQNDGQYRSVGDHGQPRLRLKLNRHGRSGEGPTFWGMWEDERSRMVYVSWLPRAARANDRSEKKKCELALKEFISKSLGFSGLQKVLLFPPSSAHCKLLFGSEQAAVRFLGTFGGMEGETGPSLWKCLVCQYFSVSIRGGIHATRVRIIWADQTKNETSRSEGTAPYVVAPPPVATNTTTTEIESNDVNCTCP